jgi:hypothetical protein
MDPMEEKVVQMYITSIVGLLVFGIILSTASQIFDNTEPQEAAVNARTIPIPTHE